jgi:hypothetical protein
MACLSPVTGLPQWKIGTCCTLGLMMLVRENPGMVKDLAGAGKCLQKGKETAVFNARFRVWS